MSAIDQPRGQAQPGEAAVEDQDPPVRQQGRVGRPEAVGPAVAQPHRGRLRPRGIAGEQHRVAIRRAVVLALGEDQEAPVGEPDQRLGAAIAAPAPHRLRPRRRFGAQGGAVVAPDHVAALERDPQMVAVGQQPFRIAARPPAARPRPLEQRIEADRQGRRGAGQREAHDDADVADRGHLAGLDMHARKAAEPFVVAVQRPAGEEMQAADVAPRRVAAVERDRRRGQRRLARLPWQAAAVPGRTIVASSTKIASRASGRLQRPRQIRSGKPPSFMNECCRTHSGPAQGHRAK